MRVVDHEQIVEDDVVARALLYFAQTARLAMATVVPLWVAKNILSVYRTRGRAQ
jgi:hypothetical protein